MKQWCLKAVSQWAWLGQSEGSAKKQFSSPFPTPHSHPIPPHPTPSHISPCTMQALTWQSSQTGHRVDSDDLFFLSLFCALDSWQSTSHTLQLPSDRTLKTGQKLQQVEHKTIPIYFPSKHQSVLDVPSLLRKAYYSVPPKISCPKLCMSQYAAHHSFCHPLLGLFPHGTPHMLQSPLTCGTLAL